MKRHFNMHSESKYISPWYLSPFHLLVQTKKNMKSVGRDVGQTPSNITANTPLVQIILVKFILSNIFCYINMERHFTMHSEIKYVSPWYFSPFILLVQTKIYDECWPWCWTDSVQHHGQHPPHPNYPLTVIHIYLNCITFYMWFQWGITSNLLDL